MGLSNQGGGNLSATDKNLASIANATARLNASGTPLSALSQSYANTGSQSFGQQALSALSPLADLADTGLNFVERPAQAILHGLQAFSGTKGNITGQTLENAGSGFLKGLTDFSGKDNLNLRSTLNMNPNAGGRLAGLFDTIGTSAIDPLTYVTAGLGAAGKVGLKVIESSLGKDVAAQVAKSGIKSLGEPTQAAIKDAFMNSDQAARVGADKFTKNAINALQDGNGLKFAGRTVVKSSTVAPIAEAAHIPQAINAIKGTTAAQTLRQAFVPMAKVADLPNINKDITGQISDVLRQGRAQEANAGADVVSQVQHAIKDSKLSLKDLKGLADHFEGNGTRQLSPQESKLVDTLQTINTGGKTALQSATAQDLSVPERLMQYLGHAPDVQKTVPAHTLQGGVESQLPLELGQTAHVPGFEYNAAGPDVTKSVAGKDVKVGTDRQLPMDLGMTTEVQGRKFLEPNLKASFDHLHPGSGLRGADERTIAGHTAASGPETQLGLALDQLVHIPGFQYTAKGADIIKQVLGKDVAAGAETQLPLALEHAGIHVPERSFTVKGAQPELTKTLEAFSGKSLGNEQLFNTPTLDRIVTKQTQKAVSQNPTQIARALSLDASATPANIIKHLQTALPNEGLAAANERLSPLVGVKNALETNPLKVLTESTVQAHRDAATADTLKGLMDITDEAGKPIVSTVQRAGDVGRNTVLGKVFGPQEVLNELDHAGAALTDDHALKAFGAVMDKWSKLWRGYATVPVLFGLGFHERNLVGNVFNMWLKGFHDPRNFVTSDKIIRAVGGGMKQGLTADASIEAARSLSPEERQWIRLARKEGVISDSFFRTDQAVTPSIGKSTARKVGEAVNPLSTHNPVLQTGTAIGRRIEDNNRLAMFIDQMKKHGDPQIAADNTKAALFDYSELTPTEKALKRVVPFYTYMRKNTPLQIQTLLKNPGKFSAVAHARDNLAAGAPGTDGKAIPQYALANGAIPLVGGDEPILGAMQLPFQNATQNIQPLLGMLSQLPGVPGNLKTEGGVGPQLAQILSNVGGGPAELAKFGAEEATGKSIFTGQNLKPGTGASRFAQTLFPIAGKGDTTISQLGSSDPAVQKARLISMLTGLQTNVLSPNVVAGEEARRAQALQALIPKDAQTTAQLRKTGAAPKAKPRASKSKATKGSLSSLPKVKKTGSSLPKIKTATKVKIPKVKGA